MSLETARAQWPRIPNVPYSGVRNVPGAWDYTQLLANRLIYPVLATRLDADGNQKDGVIHPYIAAPVATYTGDSIRTAGYAPGEQCSLQGNMIAFPRNPAQRTGTGDQRDFVDERYAQGKEMYSARIHEAARSLVRERLLLQEDADKLVRDAPWPQ